jgi:predicted cupin superfamily sugar epimerase
MYKASLPPRSWMIGDVDARAAAEAWSLEPHPEGGFYRETYRSPLIHTPDGWDAPRALATAILYLLPAAERSAWHRVRGDELWLYQAGAAMVLSVDDYVRVVGPDRLAGQEPQVLVPGGVWQSATPDPSGGDAWSLVACVVVPGFDFDDFELRREEKATRS